MQHTYMPGDQEQKFHSFMYQIVKKSNFVDVRKKSIYKVLSFRQLFLRPPLHGSYISCNDVSWIST